MKKQEEIQKINPYVSNRESILALPPPIINRLIARPNISIKYSSPSPVCEPIICICSNDPLHLLSLITPLITVKQKYCLKGKLR